MLFELFAGYDLGIPDGDHPSLSDTGIERHAIDWFRVSDEVQGSVQVSSRMRRHADGRYVADIAPVHIRNSI